MTLTRRSFLSGSAVAAASAWATRAAWAEQARKPAGFTFVQMCDTQLGMGGYEHDVETFKLAVEHINGLTPRPAFVVICGDLVNTPGSEKEIKDFRAIKAGFKMECFCVPGNHDVGNEPKPELLKTYRESMGEDYFSKELTDCVLIGVNTQLWKSPLGGESDKQTAWLEKALGEAAAARKPIIAFGHYPLFLAEAQEKEEYFNLPVKSRLHLLRLFKEHGVAAYLSGHTHRNLIKAYGGIQLVTSATTSRNFDAAPMGFRLWQIRPARPYRHEYIGIKGAKPPADQRTPSPAIKPAASQPA